MDKKYIDDMQDYLDFLCDTTPAVNDYYQIMAAMNEISQCPGKNRERELLLKIESIAGKIDSHPILKYSAVLCLKQVVIGAHREFFEKIKNIH